MCTVSNILHGSVDPTQKFMLGQPELVLSSFSLRIVRFFHFSTLIAIYLAYMNIFS